MGSERVRVTVSESICYISAEEALRRFRERSLTPSELMEAMIERCEVVNPYVNAITNRFYESARKQAAEADRRYQEGSARLLEGLPFAVKELHPIVGVTTSWGSKVFEGVEADRTLPALQRMFDAGAIMHIRTTTPEFAHAGHCHSPLYGTTRNPWNVEFSSAGSSGGSAVAAAAGMTVLAWGDDGGGSIRMPASACGVVGYKPPFGRNPCLLLDTIFESIIHIGPIARTVGDAALVQNVISGQHPDDITTIREKVIIPSGPGTVAGTRIAFSPDLGYAEVDSEVAQNTQAAAALLSSAGADVERVNLGWDESTYDAWITHWEGLFGTILGAHMQRWQYQMDPFVRGLVLRGQNLGAVRVKNTEIVRSQMWAKLSGVFAEYDILISPTLAIPAPYANHRNDDESFTINGTRVHPYLGWALTYPFNLLSQCPVITVPSGFASSGVPTGLQIIGKPFSDESVFEVAKAFEKLAPWDQIHPHI